MAELETVIQIFACVNEEDLLDRMDEFINSWNFCCDYDGFMRIYGVRNIIVTWNETDGITAIVIFYGKYTLFSRAKYELRVRLEKLRGWLESLTTRL